jgi:hypothetical protein
MLHMIVMTILLVQCVIVFTITSTTRGYTWLANGGIITYLLLLGVISSTIVLNTIITL